MPRSPRGWSHPPPQPSSSPYSTVPGTDVSSEWLEGRLADFVQALCAEWTTALPLVQARSVTIAGADTRSVPRYPGAESGPSVSGRCGCPGSPAARPRPPASSSAAKIVRTASPVPRWKRSGSVGAPLSFPGPGAPGGSLPRPTQPASTPGGVLGPVRCVRGASRAYGVSSCPSRKGPLERYPRAQRLAGRAGACSRPHALLMGCLGRPMRRSARG